MLQPGRAPARDRGRNEPPSEQHREYSRSARGPGIEDVDESSPGMQRLRAEESAQNTEAFDAFVWVTATGDRFARLPHRGRVRALAFLPDGVRLVTACEDGDATVWSVGDGQRLASFTHSGRVGSSRRRLTVPACSPSRTSSQRASVV